jgi:S1-C subfamily serine protease
MKKYFNFFIIVLIVASFMFVSGRVDINNINNNGLSNINLSEGIENADMTPRLISTNDNLSSVEVSRGVSPAVVGISSEQYTNYSVGSGVAIASGGYVLTNKHVLVNTGAINLYLADGSQASAKYIWGDNILDLAIIKSSIDLPYLQIAEGDEAKVGQDVLAIGTPLQLQFKHSVTKGIVSALNRTVQIDDDGNAGSYMQSLIQHDASINPGNSGGPLIDSNSKVIGINTLKIESAEGMAFAIPASVIKGVVESVIKNGTFQSAYMGLFAYDASIPYYYKKTKRKKGVYVIDVAGDSPAEKAGFKKGDVIVAIDEKNIDSMRQFQTNFYSYKEGDNIKIKFLQQGHNKIVELTLGKKEDNQKQK